MPQNERRLVSIPVAAEYAGVHPDTIRKLISVGNLKGLRLKGTRVIRVSLDDVDQLFKPIPTTGPGAA